jgi:hypothetical protein
MNPLNNSINPTEREILDLVINRFITERKATSRRELVQMFENPELLDRMVKRSMLLEQDRQLYLPTALAFEFCQLPDVAQSARNAVGVVLKCLQSLYKTESQKNDFTPAEVKERASKLFEISDDETIWLGMYLIREFPVLDTYSWDPEGIKISSIRPSERIILVKDIGSQWKKLIDQRTAYWLPEGEFSGREMLSSLEEIDPSPWQNLSRRMTSSPMLIFISHSSQDKDVALGLIELLRAAFALTDEQIRCTSVDGFRLPSGANTDEVLKAEVREAKAFIGLITHNSLSSAYVLFELGARWGAGLHMIPVLAGIGPEALQGPLKEINSISANNIAQLHQLLSDLADTLGLSLLRAASYTRYAEKLIAELQRSSKTSVTVPPPRTPSPGNVGQEAGERKLRMITRDDVIVASKTLNWNKQLPKWTVVIEGTSFPGPAPCIQGCWLVSQ